MSKPFRAKTFESVFAVDEPRGVSWLTATSLQLDGHTDYEPNQSEGSDCKCCNWYGTFPVSTKELLGKKGTALAVGDIFSLTVNLSASSPADVAPEVHAYHKPITDEEFEKIISGE